MTFHTVAADSALFTDRNKTLWLFALCWLSLPAVASFVAVATYNEFLYWVVPIVWFGLVPLVDHIAVRDSCSPSDAQAAYLDSQRYYSFLIGLAVPITYAALFYCAWTVTESPTSMFGLAGVGVSLGIIIGTLITISLAYARSETRSDKLLAFLATAIVGFGHFRIAHTVAHQQACATPSDPCSARMGESLYKFFLRSLRGTIGQAWDFEQRRLAESGRITQLVRNEVLRSLIFAGILHGTIVAVVGLRILPALLIAIIFAWIFQTIIVYVQHYGLLREKRVDGTYVSCSSQHAWNSTHAASSVFLFNATRHADHHAHPARRYQSMGVDSAAAQLPFGFAAAIIIAALPPLWFRRMDPAVAEWADGDLLKVNIDGGAYTDLMAKYHRPAG